MVAIACAAAAPAAAQQQTAAAAANSPAVQAAAAPETTVSTSATGAPASGAASDQLWPSAVQGQETPRFAVGGGYLHQFSAGIDNGASMSADRFYASLSSRLVQSGDFNLVLSMGYEFDWYHWRGTSSLGTNDPFGSVNLLGVQLRGSYQLAPEWAIMAGGIFGVAGETNADVGSSLYGGGIASLSWTPQKDFILGLGVLGVTQIEDDPIVIPVPVVHIRFAEEWVVSTIRRPPASPFVGIDVAWEPKDSPLDASIGVGWQQRRFRLGQNTDPLLNNGVGEDQSWAAIGAVGYDILPSLRADLVIGVTFYEKLQLETAAGRSPRDATVAPNALLGAFVTWRF